MVKEMNNKLKKLTSMLLALAMIATCIAPTDAFAKSTKQYVTRAYVLQQVEKLIGATQTSADIDKVKDVSKGASYYNTMSIALNAGLVKPDSSNKLYPNKKATKKYVATILARVSESTSSKVLGQRNPKALLTKTTLKKMINNIYPNVVSKSSTKVGKGNVMINKPVTLSDATISGDLVIGDGVADKEVTLNNVTVKGKVIVRGGGENSIIITGTSNISNIVIRQVNNKVSLKVTGDAKVSMVYINDGSNDVNIVGQVGSLNVIGKNLTVTLTDASVNSLTVVDTAKNAVIVADKDSTVKEATLNAAGTEVKGDGKVETVNVNANDTIVTVSSDKINTKDDVTPPKTTEDDKNTNTDTPASDDSGSVSGGGSTSGGGSSSGGSSEGGSTSGGGSSSGGSSEGGSTSGDGFDEPIEPEIKYVTDERFAEGYPKVVADKETGKITVKYKLKEGVASEENPAMIYNVVSDYNTSWDATTDAVIHGHMGIVTNEKHDTVESEYYDFLLIKDTEEHSADYEIYGDGTDGLVVYSVIDCDGVKSDTPTKIAFDRDTTSSTIVQSISVSSIYLNKDRNAIYMYIRSQLDDKNVSSGDEFAIKSNGTKIDRKVNKVEILENATEDNGNPYACIKLSLESPLPQSADNSTRDASYELVYEGTTLQDTLGNKLKAFEHHISNASTSIDKAYVSNDGQYINIDVPVSLVMSYDPNSAYADLELYVDDRKMSRENWNYSWSVERIGIQVCDKTLINPKKVEIKSAGGKILYNAAGDALGNLTISDMKKDSESCISSVSYNKSENKLLVTLRADDGLSGTIDACNFILKIGEREYHLRGRSYVAWDYQNGGKVYQIKLENENIKHIDLSNVSEMSMRYLPIGIKDSGYSRHGFLTYNSGKPVSATDFIQVTVQ